MIKQLIQNFSILLMLAGCTSHQTHEQLLFHDNGMCKPKIALFDLRNTSEATLPWDLSEEFTTEISQQIRSIDKLFLIREDEIAWQYPIQAKHLKPFHDHSWIKENSPDTEFVIFVELMEHDIVPKNPEQDSKSKISFNLNVSARIKVIDVREDIPIVILQEIISQSHLIPWQFAGIDYSSVRWGKSLFSVTPIGLAHRKLTKTIVKRIEEYILLAKSR